MGEIRLLVLELSYEILVLTHSMSIIEITMTNPAVSNHTAIKEKKTLKIKKFYYNTTLLIGLQYNNYVVYY